MSADWDRDLRKRSMKMQTELLEVSLSRSWPNDMVAGAMQALRDYDFEKADDLIETMEARDHALVSRPPADQRPVEVIRDMLSTEVSAIRQHMERREREWQQAIARRIEASGRVCPENPLDLTGKPIGQYHCPACGCMQLAGLRHLAHDEACWMLEMSDPEWSAVLAQYAAR